MKAQSAALRRSTACLIALAIPLISTPVHAATPTTGTTLKACMNTKTGIARVVSAKTKCLKTETQVAIYTPPPSTQPSLLHGTTPPKMDLTGKDGDFYIDTSVMFLYGPRERGLWGPGVPLKGSDGVNGAQGPTGTAGNGILSGPGKPTDDVTGKDGDFFIDTKDRILYGPRSSGIWGPGLSLVGPAGSNGSNGSTGATGATGAQGPQGIQGPQGLPGGYGDYGSFYDTSTVTLAPSTSVAIPLGQTQFANGISIVSGSRITFSHAGKFNIAFSIQLFNTDNRADTTNIWLAKNGTAVPWSNTSILTNGNNTHTVAAWNFFVSAAAGDYYQLMVNPGATTGTNTQLISDATLTPQIPATILTVNQVG